MDAIRDVRTDIVAYCSRLFINCRSFVHYHRHHQLSRRPIRPLHFSMTFSDQVSPQNWRIDTAPGSTGMWDNQFLLVVVSSVGWWVLQRRQDWPSVWALQLQWGLLPAKRCDQKHMVNKNVQFTTAPLNLVHRERKTVYKINYGLLVIDCFTSPANWIKRRAPSWVTTAFICASLYSRHATQDSAQSQTFNHGTTSRTTDEVSRTVSAYVTWLSLHADMTSSIYTYVSDGGRYSGLYYRRSDRWSIQQYRLCVTRRRMHQDQINAARAARRRRSRLERRATNTLHNFP